MHIFYWYELKYLVHQQKREFKKNCVVLYPFLNIPCNISFHIFSIQHFSMNPLLFLKIFWDRIFYVDFKVYHSCWKWFNWKKFTSLCSEWIRHLFLRPRNCLPVVWAWKYLVINKLWSWKYPIKCLFYFKL